MKKNLNNILLEAVHRGILMALDDFNDNENLIGQLTETIKDQNITTGYLALDDFDDHELLGQLTLIIKNQNITKDYLDLLDNFVDLGLPSGTIWAKYNLGVNPDKLETFKDWRGEYYAWGELEEKDDYVLETYTFIDDEHYITKYTYNRLHADGKEILDLEDDVAYQNPIIYKDKKYMLRIPSIELFEELKNNTTSKYIRNYNHIHGMHVIEYTSKINGNKIIFPLGGYKPEEAALDGLAIDGQYWTNHVDVLSDVKAWIFAIAANYSVISKYRSYRAHGRNIRPVLFDKNIFVNNEIK